MTCPHHMFKSYFFYPFLPHFFCGIFTTKQRRGERSYNLQLTTTYNVSVLTTHLKQQQQLSIYILQQSSNQFIFLHISECQSLSSSLAKRMTSRKNQTGEPSQPQTMAEYDNRSNYSWLVSFTATMFPFLAFCYGHQRGVTVRVLERLAKTNAGMYGIIAIPIVTLTMEKCIYDSVQSLQGIDPNVVPADRGGFPSGGSNLPSFSLISVQKTNLVEDFIQKNILGRSSQVVRKMSQRVNETQSNNDVER